MYLKQRCNSKARVFPFTLVVSHPHHIYASTGSIGFVEMSGATRLSHGICERRPLLARERQRGEIALQPRRTRSAVLLDSGEPFSGKVPFFVICIFLARRYIRYTSPAQAESPHTFLGIIRRIDLPGCILLASWIGFALTAVSLVTNSTTGSPTWSCPEVIGLFVASGVVFLFFLVWELKIVEYPVVPVEILNRRTPIAVAINNFVLSVVTFALVRISSHDSSLRSISLTRAVDVLGPPVLHHSAPYDSRQCRTPSHHRTPRRHAHLLRQRLLRSLDWEILLSCSSAAWPG